VGSLFREQQRAYGRSIVSFYRCVSGEN
jgi:hypothetical protein